MVLRMKENEAIMTQGKKIIWTVEKEKKFLKGLSQGFSVSRAGKLIKVSRSGCYNHRDESESFRQAWENAYAEGTDALEEVAQARATEKSDVLMIFLLKARDPERFKDKWQGDLRTDICVEAVSYEDKPEEKD